MPTFKTYCSMLVRMCLHCIQNAWSTFIEMEEIWKDVKGFEGLYQVSNLGRIKSYAHKVKCRGGFRVQPSKILTNCFDGNYYHVTLFKTNKRKLLLVHRIVAMAFLDNHENKRTVNHIDGNKQNNKVDNLEWATYSENIKHAFSTGLNMPHDGGTSKPILEYDLNGNFVREYKSINDAARVLHISTGNIWSVLNKKTKQIKGRMFKYK